MDREVNVFIIRTDSFLGHPLLLNNISVRNRSMDRQSTSKQNLPGRTWLTSALLICWNFYANSHIETKCILQYYTISEEVVHSYKALTLEEMGQAPLWKYFSLKQHVASEISKTHGFIQWYRSETTCMSIRRMIQQYSHTSFVETKSEEPITKCSLPVSVPPEARIDGKSPVVGENLSAPSYDNVHSTTSKK